MKLMRTGDRIGVWIVLSPVFVGSVGKRKKLWKCRCACGGEATMRRENIARTKGCRDCLPGRMKQPRPLQWKPVVLKTGVTLTRIGPKLYEAKCSCGHVRHVRSRSPGKCADCSKQGYGKFEFGGIRMTLKDAADVIGVSRSTASKLHRHGMLAERYSQALTR